MSAGRPSLPTSDIRHPTSDIRQRLLSNVWCGQCRHETTITNFSGTIKGGDLLQDILQIEVGIVSVELGGLDQTRQLSPDEML